MALILDWIGMDLDLDGLDRIGSTLDWIGIELDSL